MSCTPAVVASSSEVVSELHSYIMQVLLTGCYVNTADHEALTIAMLRRERVD
jgi:hypothetical protein